MNANQLFRQTRWRLAFWYAGIMAAVLFVSGFGVYEAIAYISQVTTEHELKAFAKTLQTSLARSLKQSDRWDRSDATVRQRLLEFCPAGENCSSHAIPIQASPRYRLFRAVHQDVYYIRVLNAAGDAIAWAGEHPPGLQPASENPWQLLRDKRGQRYRQIALPLPGQNGAPWGTLQVGRYLSDVDEFLANLRFILFASSPFILFLTMASGWWLAGLAMKPIYQSYQQMQQFAVDAAHELRTPLAAARATIEATLRSPQSSTTAAWHALKVAQQQNVRLTRLANDLLLLSDLEGPLTDPKARCCLQDLVSDIEEELWSLAAGAQIAIAAEIRTSQPLIVVGNEDHLYRLILNLAMNAIQYTPPGGTILLLLDRDDTSAILQVRDTGIGIVSEHLPRIFDRFYRASSDRSRRTGGSGLGLSIAQAIAEAHKGTIQVQSQVGKGSLFTVHLPTSD